MKVFQLEPLFDRRNWFGSLTSSRAITSTLTFGLDVVLSTWLMATVPVGGSESRMPPFDTTNVVAASLSVTFSRD